MTALDAIRARCQRDAALWPGATSLRDDVPAILAALDPIKMAAFLSTHPALSHVESPAILEAVDDWLADALGVEVSS